MAAANQRLGEYILIDRIGAGTFGEVWRARHHAWAEQVVAIKIPSDAHFVHYLQREGTAIGRLIHPNIVKAIAFDPYNDPAYLVMEFVRGPNLRDLIKKGPLPVADAVAIMKQVLSALHQAHGRGIIHRDIKPENILIDQHIAKSGFNKPGAVKLSDFGLGSTETQNPNSIVYSTDRHDSKHIVGSAPYMSPEQRQGAAIDARSDLYSCGVVFFEMLTGQRPAGAESPSEMNAKVPEPIDEIFRKAYSRLDRRFASAEEFFNALKSALGDQKRARIDRRRIAKMLPWFVGLAGVVMIVVIWLMPIVFSRKDHALSNAMRPEINSPAPTGDSASPLIPPVQDVTPVIPYSPASPAVVSPANAPPQTPTTISLAGLPPLQPVSSAPQPAVALAAAPATFPSVGSSPDELARAKAAAVVAQAKYDSAFADDLAYQQAKAAVDKARADVDSLSNTASPGSPELTAASQNLVDAKSALTKETARVTAKQSQLRITILLETAKANDTPQNSRVALTALNELLNLDPKNSEALALRDKLNPDRPTIDTLGVKLIAIKPGTFSMGSPAGENERYPDESRHTVTISKGFFIATTAVTVSQFTAFVGSTNYQTDAEREGWSLGWTGSTWDKIHGSSWRKPNDRVGFTQGDDHPVVCVSWNDSVGFCDWLSKQEGKHYRLPTEAEWEYAARAGTQTTWWWGDNPDDGAGAANLFDATCKARFVTGWTGIFNWSDGYCFTSPVGRFKPNAWGLYDMIGNACEWCSDWYGDYPKGDATDPQGPTSGQDRVARGSSWSDVSRTSRCAMRCHAAPSARNDHLGLRLVLDAG